MATDFRVGGLSHNCFDVDADGLYLYLAVLNTSDQPQILKMKSDLSEDATVAYDPGGGSEVNLMVGDYSPYWVWAVGDFGGNARVVQQQDTSFYWYTRNDPGWAEAARPILVGPGDDSLLTTSTGLSLRQNRYVDGLMYWVESYIPGTIYAVDRADYDFDEMLAGGYWYTGDSSEIIDYSPNSGLGWENITGGLPNATVTTLLID